MADAGPANPKQAAHWNDRAGRSWAELADLLDRLLAPFVPLLLDAIEPVAGSRILDVGCGSGALTRAAAGRSGPQGSCLGIDISAPLIAAAEARTKAAGPANARFLRADAQTSGFGGARFDALVSRFGVMFFADPAAAFANLRSAMREDARLAFAAWRSPEENGFLTAAERAAAPLIPNLPQRDPHGPGPLAFADPARVRAILEESGWREVAIDAVDVGCSLPAADIGTYATRIGPLGEVFSDLDEPMKAEVAGAVEAAFAPYIDGGTARFAAACWRVTARASRP